MWQPNSRPQLAKADALMKLVSFGDGGYNVKLLGVRGYYKKSTGNPDTNDIGCYDDAFFLIGPDHYSAWNGNTDPSKIMPGIATLKAGGPYLYKKGIHGMHHLSMTNDRDRAIYNTLLKTGKDVAEAPLTYWALRQYGNVTVKRGNTFITDSPTNRFYIDIHKGGINTTSSEGCQTIVHDEWQEFFWNNVLVQLDKNQQTILPYYLVEA